jgi:hypothetical protein
MVSLSQKDIHGSKSNKMRQVRKRDELDNEEDRFTSNKYIQLITKIDAEQ